MSTGPGAALGVDEIRSQAYLSARAAARLHQAVKQEAAMQLPALDLWEQLTGHQQAVLIKEQARRLAMARINAAMSQAQETRRH